MLDLLEKTCIIHERFSKGSASSGNVKSSYYIATDKESAQYVGSDISKCELINRLHKEQGYHKFEIVSEEVA